MKNWGLLPLLHTGVSGLMDSWATLWKIFIFPPCPFRSILNEQTESCHSSLTYLREAEECDLWGNKKSSLWWNLAWVFQWGTLLLHHCSEVMQFACATEFSMTHFACPQLWSGSGLIPHCGLQCSALIGLGTDALCDLSSAEDLFISEDATIIPLKLHHSQNPPLKPRSLLLYPDFSLCFKSGLGGLVFLTEVLELILLFTGYNCQQWDILPVTI